MNIENTTNDNDTNDNDTNDNDTNDIKKIVIIDTILQNKHIKKINCIKEKKMRVETKTWGLNENELSHQTQLNMLFNKLEKVEKVEKDKYMSMLISHIKTKICSYKQQDIFKKKLNEEQFVTFEEVVELLKICGLTCHYCSEHVFILYEKVRETKQWSLDRINNDLPHTKNNCFLSCYICNCSRR